MKKIIVLLVGLLAMFSCEQEDLEGIVKSDTGQVQTRATASIADFDPISELANIPVNILNVGNTKYKYLTGARDNNCVWLVEEDNGSMWQRWYINHNDIVLIGDLPYDWCVSPGFDIDYPIIAPSTPPTLHTLFHASNNSTYCIEGLLPVMGSMPPAYSSAGYLQAKDNSSSDLKFRDSNSSAISRWRIVPVGEYRLVDVQYEKSVEAGDFINQKDQFVRGTIIPARPEAVEHTITVTEKVTESSTFTETNGVTTQKQSSFNWGLQAGKAPLPVISIGGSLNNTVTSSHTVSYAESGSYEVSVSQSFKVLVPANKACTIEVLKMSYNTSLTYVATLEKRDGAEAGEKFRIKGKWDGIVTTFLYYKMYENATNKLLETKIIDEQ